MTDGFFSKLPIPCLGIKNFNDIVNFIPIRKPQDNTVDLLTFSKYFLLQKIAKKKEVVDVSSHKVGNTTKFIAFLDEPNWEVEQSIYKEFGKLVSSFPDLDIDVEVIELFGRKPEEIDLLLTKE